MSDDLAKGGHDHGRAIGTRPVRAGLVWSILLALCSSMIAGCGAADAQENERVYSVAEVKSAFARRGEELDVTIEFGDSGSTTPLVASLEPRIEGEGEAPYEVNVFVDERSAEQHAENLAELNKSVPTDSLALMEGNVLVIYDEDISAKRLFNARAAMEDLGSSG